MWVACFVVRSKVHGAVLLCTFLWLPPRGPEPCPTAHACMPHRNSEIYNHDEVKAKYLKGVKMVKGSKSDSAIIGHLYEVHPPSSMHAELLAVPDVKYLQACKGRCSWTSTGLLPAQPCLQLCTPATLSLGSDCLLAPHQLDMYRPPPRLGKRMVRVC